MIKKVLVIDDDREFGQLLDVVLRQDGVNVFHAYSGREGMKLVYDVHPDLIILDIMMPDMDGITVCSHLREMVDTPILMITALSNEREILRAFTAGVDDFLKKPFSNAELRARVQALLRRSHHQLHDETHITAYADSVLEIDFSLRAVKLLGKLVELSPKEYELLGFLVREQGKLISHHELARKVWGDSYGNAKAVVSLYVYYLRKKLQDGKHGHQYLCTHWGRGYWFAPRNEENQ